MFVNLIKIQNLYRFGINPKLETQVYQIERFNKIKLKIVNKYKVQKYRKGCLRINNNRKTCENFQQ